MKPKDQPMQDGGIDEASIWCLRLADGRLSPKVQSEFNAWLANADNAHAFDDVARTWQALEATSVSPGLIEMRRGALEVFQRGHASQWARNVRPRRRTMVALAACFLAVVIGVAFVWSHFPFSSSYETGLGERRVVVLNDGSKISLDAQSRVDVRYRGDRRELWLKRGRAKFDVARDSLRPFTVAAADKIVVAIGTEFSVELLSSQVRVILYSGSVEVLAEQPDNKLEPVRSLKQGEELISGSSESVARLEASDPVRSLSWEAGQLVFTNETLIAAVERMNRYTSSPLSIGDARAGAIRISGVYAAGDVNAFIEGITGVFPVRVETVGDRHTFVSTESRPSR